MKIRIEVIDNNIEEDEIIIRCGRVDENISKIQQFIIEHNSSDNKLTFYKQNKEYYFPLDEVLFFETDGEGVYAHTANDAYRIKYRLFELEEILPRQFIRAAKSSIVNTARIYSITRNLTASSLINFINSHKSVYVSRYYYRELRKQMDERKKY